VFDPSSAKAEEEALCTASAALPHDGHDPW
jgi:hypothetical protein